MNEQIKKKLEAIMRPKFNAYVNFTQVLVRLIPEQNGAFTYPNDSMISDLIVFWSMFCEVYEMLGPQGLEKIIKSNPLLLRHFNDLFNKGNFLKKSDSGFNKQNDLNNSLEDYLKTLRNGYSHFHWCYENLSAIEYWNKMNWNISNSLPTFLFTDYPAKNYTIYIADSHDWNPEKFWQLCNLRMIIIENTHLRFYLHGFLNQLLNENDGNIFGGRMHFEEKK